MLHSLKGKFLLLLFVMIIGMCMLGGFGVVVRNSVNSTAYTTEKMQKGLFHAQAMRTSAGALLTETLQMIVDRETGTVSVRSESALQEIQEQFSEHTEFLSELLASQKGDTQADDTQQVEQVVSAFARYHSIVSEELTGLIKSSHQRLADLDMAFSRFSERIEQAAAGLEKDLFEMERLFNLHIMAGDLFYKTGLERVVQMRKAHMEMRVATMEAMQDRLGGSIDPKRQKTLELAAQKLESIAQVLSMMAVESKEQAVAETINGHVKTLVQGVRTELPALMEFYGSQRADIAQEFETFSAEVRKQGADIVGDLDSLSASFAERQHQAQVELKSNIASMAATGGFVFLATIVCVAFGFWLAGRSIITDVNQAVAFADAVAGGNLNSEYNRSERGEIGRLAVSLRTMVSNLKTKIAEADAQHKEAIKQSERAAQALVEAEEARKKAESARKETLLETADTLEGVVGDVSESAGELDGVVGEVTSGAREQHARIEETATAMEQMKHTVMEVARNASHAASASDTAKEKAMEGARVVSDVVAAIHKAEKQFAIMQTGLNKLDEYAGGIGEIMVVISDIADQTNLLALNAAIEAARAGDAGRGFAVVADEVRKLAEKTMQATREVGEAVEQIQRGTKTTISDMTAAGEAVAQSTALAYEAGESLSEIVSIVGDSNDQIRSIATASEEQSAAAEQIGEAVLAVSRIAEQTTDGMQLAERTLHALRTRATDMSDMVNMLRNG